MYIYIIFDEYKIYLYELWKEEEKRPSGKLFFPVSRQVQIYFIFPDIVCVLCLYCNVMYA